MGANDRTRNIEEGERKVSEESLYLQNCIFENNNNYNKNFKSSQIVFIIDVLQIIVFSDYF